MKYVIIRCEDGVGTEASPLPLLEGAKIEHLEHLAQAGAAGTIRLRPDDLSSDRLLFHRALLGLAPDDPDAAPARCYAAAANVSLARGDTAWCCDFVTHHDGMVVDPACGQIPTTQSEVLIRALNSELSSDTRRWEVGEGAHHLLVATDAALQVDRPVPVPSPERLLGQRWEAGLPKGAVGDALGALITQASKVLEQHPINRVRLDLSENPANLMWLWGPADGASSKSLTERTRLSGALLSGEFAMRGLASTLGLDWRSGPDTFTERAVEQTAKAVSSLIARRDLVYVHLRIDSVEPVDRLCAIERIDRLLLKPLTDALPKQGPWRLLMVVDHRMAETIPFVALGTGLPQRPAARLDADAFKDASLSFPNGMQLFTWFTQASI